MTKSTAISRLPHVLSLRGRSRSAHYLDIQQGLYTKPVRLSARSVGWPSYEAEALNAARIAGHTDEQIRELVRRLHAERANIAAITSAA